MGHSRNDGERIRLDALTPTWGMTMADFVITIACVTTLIAAAYDFELFEMIEFKHGLIGKVFNFIPAPVWELLSGTFIILSYLQIQRSIAEYTKSLNGLWYALIAVSGVGTLINMVTDVLALLFIVADLALLFVIGLKISKKFAGGVGGLGRIFMWVPIAGIALLFIVAAFLPEDYGDVEQTVRSFGRYRSVYESYNLTTIIFTAVMALLAAAVDTLPLVRAKALFKKGASEEEYDVDTDDEADATGTEEENTATEDAMETPHEETDKPLTDGAPPIPQKVETEPEPESQPEPSSAVADTPATYEGSDSRRTMLFIGGGALGGCLVGGVIAIIILIATAAIYFFHANKDTDKAAIEMADDYPTEEEFVDYPTEEEFATVDDAFLEPGNYKMPGTIDGKYDITMWLMIDDNGEVKGRYCYDSTVRKYGDKPESYFYIKGYVDGSSTLRLDTFMKGDDSKFENITLWFNGNGFTGEYKNYRTGGIHNVELRL